MLAGILPIEIVADKINQKSAKVLRVRSEEKQVTLLKWKEWLSESFKGEWIHLLKYKLKAWLKRGHGRMNFYLTQVVSAHGAFNTYIFRMKLMESSKCTNCNRRG